MRPTKVAADPENDKNTTDLNQPQHEAMPVHTD